MPASASSVAVIRLSNVEEMQKHAWPLFEKHYDELIRREDRDALQLKPHWLRYQAMEQADVLLVIAAWVGGDLAGYSVNVITPLLHYADTIVCQNDLFFVDPDFRKATIGGDSIGKVLAVHTKMEAKNRGASRLLWHAKPGTALDIILQRRGVPVRDLIYDEVL